MLSCDNLYFVLRTYPHFVRMRWVCNRLAQVIVIQPPAACNQLQKIMKWNSFISVLIYGFSIITFRKYLCPPPPTERSGRVPPLNISSGDPPLMTSGGDHWRPGQTCSFWDPPLPRATFGGVHWNWSMYGFQAGGTHSTGMLSCFIVWTFYLSLMIWWEQILYHVNLAQNVQVFVEFWERHNSMVSLVNMFYYQSSEKFALPAILTRELGSVLHSWDLMKNAVLPHRLCEHSVWLDKHCTQIKLLWDETGPGWPLVSSPTILILNTPTPVVMLACMFASRTNFPLAYL